MSGWIGSTTAGYLSPSATCPRLKPKRATTLRGRCLPEPRDPSQNASEKPGAVQCVLDVEDPHDPILDNHRVALRARAEAIGYSLIREAERPGEIAVAVGEELDPLLPAPLASAQALSTNTSFTAVTTMASMLFARITSALVT